MYLLGVHGYKGIKIPMERDAIKVMPKFHDDIKFVVADPKFPFKNMSQFFTLATWKWLKDFDGATASEKQEMIKKMIRLREEAEDEKYLHNSRDIVEVTDE